MPHNMMTNCEQKKQFMLTSKREWLWVEVPVALVGTSYAAIRCMYCHGAVRVHQQKVGHGPKDHVEHRSRQDSQHCKGGIHFQGEHRLSLQPVP
jgi:hypothetical protein